MKKTANVYLDPALQDVGDYDRHLMPTVLRYPFEVIRGEGPWLYLREPDVVDGTVQGRRVLDAWSDEGVPSMGYSDLLVQDAVTRFFGRGHPHQLPDVYPHRLRWACAERMCQLTQMDRVFYANSGAEANEAMMKLARRYWHRRGQPERHVILTVEGNFHGRTLGALAAGDPRVSPHHWEGMGPMPLGYGVLDSEWRQVVTDGRVHNPVRPAWDTVAGIILAPVLGNNVVQTYPTRFWNYLHRVRAETRVLLLFDEVQTGCGRCGPYAAWRHPSIGMKPDAMTLGKGIAMGFPMSAMLAHGELAVAFEPGTHFNTFGGSPFCCFMAIEMMRWVTAHIEEINVNGARIRARLAQLPWVKSVDGLGMLNAFLPDYDAHGGWTGYHLIQAARRERVLLVSHRSKGPIRFTMPLNTPLAQIEQAIDAVNRAARKLSGGNGI